MTDYIIKNGPDLPDGVDAAEFEQEDDAEPEPAWRVPEHLRHAAYNGWEIRRSCHKEYGDGYAAFCRPSPQGYTAVLYDGRLTDLAIVLLLTKEDFMQMQPNDVYKLGEAK